MIHRLSILLILAAVPCGCKLTGNESASAPSPSSVRQTPQEKRIAQLENELRMRDKQLEELRTRADRLAERVRRLEFLNDQLDKHLKTVGDAPRRRDLYKKRLAESELEVERLRRLIEHLQRPPDQPTSGPTTAPTRSPG